MNIDWPKYNEIFYTVMNRQQPSDYASMTRSERRTRDTIIHQKGRLLPIIILLVKFRSTKFRQKENRA